MSKSYEIEALLQEYLVSSGAENIWYEGDEEEDDEEDRANDLVRTFLSGDIITDHTFLELVYQEGGGEGQGEHVEAVFKLHGVLYKAVWSYYSHYGYSWDGLTFTKVVPREKTIIVYDEVKE